MHGRQPSTQPVHSLSKTPTTPYCSIPAAPECGSDSRLLLITARFTIKTARLSSLLHHSSHLPPSPPSTSLLLLFGILHFHYDSRPVVTCRRDRISVALDHIHAWPPTSSFPLECRCIFSLVEDRICQSFSNGSGAPHQPPTQEVTHLHLFPSSSTSEVEFRSRTRPRLATPDSHHGHLQPSRRTNLCTVRRLRPNLLARSPPPARIRLDLDETPSQQRLIPSRTRSGIVFKPKSDWVES